MARITIYRFRISDWVEAKFASHGIRRPQVEAVLDNPHVVIANRQGRAAKHLLLGRDDSGRCLAIPVLPTDDALQRITQELSRWRV